LREPLLENTNHEKTHSHRFSLTLTIPFTMKRLHTLCLFLLSLCAFGQTPVTFNVNMMSIGPSDSLHVVGNFQDPNYDNIPENLDYQNWTPSATSGLMFDPDMDFNYSVTLFLLPGRYEFKFLNGNDWPTAEVVP
jgi:hypothetical protein